MANIIFMGTPEFAVPALRAIHAALGVTTVVTAPDAARGRGLALTPSEVKSAALDLGITDILQPSSLKDPEFVAQISQRTPDIICVIAFRILPHSVYSLARVASFNVHASLLPLFRGAAPINHAIMQGCTQTGVTSFLLNDVVDTGTILLKKSIRVPDGYTAGDLYASLMPLAAECAVETCLGLLEGSLEPQPQLDAAATAAPKVFRATSEIAWNQDATTVRNFVHGLSPAPCAWTKWNGHVLKVFRASIVDVRGTPGTWRIAQNQLLAYCATGALSLTEIQLPNKKRMSTTDFLAGYRGPLEGSFV